MADAVRFWQEHGPIDRWQGFTDLISTLARVSPVFTPPKTTKWAFRGQPSAKHELNSTFDRAVQAAGKPKGSIPRPRREFELVAFREFVRRAHHFLGPQHIPPFTDKLEWLSMMRHYGAPSRLMDFTYSAFIAAYFALQSDCNEDAAVWAVDINWVHQGMRGLTGAKLHDTKTFVRYFFKEKPSRGMILHVNPVRLNERLSQQQGTFLCSADVDQNFDDAIRAQSGLAARDHIHKIRLSRRIKQEAIQQLRAMNINSASLFPDLGGFAQSLDDYLYLDYHYEAATLESVLGNELK